MVSGRLGKYIEYKKISYYAFENSLGVSRGSISKPVKDGGNIGSNVLENILLLYTDINTEWLLTGKGEMLKSTYRQDSNIIQVREREVPYEILGETRPRIPLSASAGSLSIALEGGKDYDCELIPVIKSLPYYDFTIITNGDSMQPLLYSGDELACLLIKDKFTIQWGRIYALDTTNGIIVKRIYDKGEYFICRSENDSLYKEFNVHKSTVYNLSLVVGFLRRF